MSSSIHKKLMVVLTALLTLAVFAACTTTPQATPAPQEPEPVTTEAVQQPEVEAPSGEKLTLQFYSHRFTEEPYGTILRKQVAEYEELNPNITIEIIDVPTGEASTKLISMVLGGAPPDAVFAARNMGYLKPQGVLMNLEPFIEKEGGQAYKDRFPKNAAETVMDVETGDWLGIPAETQLWTLVVNAERASEAGVDVKPGQTWTWEEFKVVADKFQDPANNKYAYVNYGYGSAGGAAITVGQWMLANGGSWWGITDNCTRVDLMTPENIEAVKNYISMGLEGYQPEGYIERGGGDHYNLMGDSSAAMAITHPGGVANALNKSQGTISAFIPVFLPGVNPKVSMYTEAWAIAEGAEHPQEAWDFINWLNTDEKALERMQAQNTLPASLSAMAKVKEVMPENAFWIDLATGTQTEPGCYEYLPRVGEIAQVTTDSLTRVYQGEEVEVVMQELEVALKELVEGD